jgi:hypothetical protein
MDRHTDANVERRRMTTTCAVCRQPFVARRKTARFCTARCRKIAERRRGGSSNVTPSPRPSAAAMDIRSLESAERSPARPTSPQQRAASPAADVTLNRNQPVGIVPDERWPNMWRLKYGDGRLSDMVNFARARDALHGAASMAARKHPSPPAQR